MFDILCDVWSRPGAVHSPMVPIDITALTTDTVETKISTLHKYGVDSLIITCSEGKTVTDDLLKELFSAAAKRYMLLFVTEDLIMNVTGCTDVAFTQYNPMLTSHTLRLAKTDENSLKGMEEVVASYHLKIDNGIVTDATESIEDDEEHEKYDIILTSCANGVDYLCPETTEMLIYGAYETFLEKYRDTFGGTLAGVLTDRLKDYGSRRLHWSYDMVRDFISFGGKPIELVSLITETDKRSRREGERIYRKTLSSRLDKCYLSPVSTWCGKNSLAFIGEVPYDFIGSCARRFTMPVYSDACFEGVVNTVSERQTAIKCLADIARGEGFTGSACICSSSDAAELTEEAVAAFAASGTTIILPSDFASSEYLESIGVSREDMKRLMFRFRRLSTLNTSCVTGGGTAVLCDDGFIPFTGAERMKENGAPFNFLSLPQAIERGRSHMGEYLVDKFRYSTLIIEPRVRMEPAEIKQIGEAAAFGGKLYRGAQFGEYAKKHLQCSAFEKENYKNLFVHTTIKSGNIFTLLVNRGEEPIMVRYPVSSDNAGFVFDPDSGNKRELMLAGAESSVYAGIRLLPGGCTVLGWDSDKLSIGTCVQTQTVREIHALKAGDNAVDLTFGEGSVAVIEFDFMDGHRLNVNVNGSELPAIISRPYYVDISSFMKDGENHINIWCDGKSGGAVLRIF